jgi:hypothetical protein
MMNSETFNKTTYMELLLYSTTTIKLAALTVATCIGSLFVSIYLANRRRFRGRLEAVYGAHGDISTMLNSVPKDVRHKSHHGALALDSILKETLTREKCSHMEKRNSGLFEVK